MRRGVKALEDSNSRDQLAWLVLRVVARLSPCTKTSLIAYVSGDYSTPELRHTVSGSHKREPIFDALTKLDALTFVQFAREQIAITDEGRRFLDDLPVVAARPRTPYFAFARASVAALLVKYTPQLKRFCQDRLTEARAVTQQGFHGGRTREIATQLWKRKVAPTIESRATTLVHILTQLTRLCRTRAEAWTIVLLNWRRQSGQLWKAVKASGLPPNAKLVGRSQLVIFGSALLVVVLSTAGGVAFLSGKRAESSQGALIVDRSDRSNSPGDAVETGEPATLITRAAPSDVDQELVRTTATDPSTVEQDPIGNSRALPVVVEQSQADPIVATIRLKLADPALRKGVASDDVAALESFYGEQSSPSVWITGVGFSAKAQAIIAEIQDADDWGLSADAFDLPPAADLPTAPEAQAADEIKLALAVLKYARFAQGGRLTPSRISSLLDQKPPLLNPKTVLSEIAAAEAPDAYLRSLHPKHEQFERLRQALLKARSNSEERGKKPGHTPEVRRLIINMERWRWMPAELGSTYVWNNVPEFIARVIKHGKTIYTEKIIVGQLKYATPIFSASMRSIVFHPEWVVPETILNEDLRPALQQGGFFGGPSTAILRQHNLKVSHQGRPVDAETVDWGTVNIRQYTFTQPHGPENVLGRLKFNFPNKHAVYMHDTPQRELFAETERTLSHGCIRVHEPDRLAALLLGEDRGWSAQQVKSLLATDRSNVVMLNRPLPVHLTYFTAVIDEKGKVDTFTDVYGLDDRMSAALFRKPVKFQGPMVEAKAQPTQRKRGDWRSATHTGGLTDGIPGLFGN
jgi:murein L,D-transpeptidase YcbB/YkuD